MSVATAMPLAAGVSKQSFHVLIPSYGATILDKTVEKIVYLGSIFLNIIAVLHSFPLPLPLKAMLLCFQKKA